MATNFPGPYEVELKYTVGGFEHKQRINCDVDVAPSVGADATTISLVTRAGGTVGLVTAVTAWVNLIKGQYHTGVSFDGFDFYKITPLTYTRTWITTHSLSIAGTFGTVYIPAQQNTFTFRTLEGNTMRIVLLESSLAGSIRAPYSTLGTTLQGIMDYVYGSTTWMLARDTSFPIAPLNLTSGQNESVFKKRYR